MDPLKESCNTKMSKGKIRLYLSGPGARQALRRHRILDSFRTPQAASWRSPKLWLFRGKRRRSHSSSRSISHRPRYSSIASLLVTKPPFRIQRHRFLPLFGRNRRTLCGRKSWNEYHHFPLCMALCMMARQAFGWSLWQVVWLVQLFEGSCIVQIAP